MRASKLKPGLYWHVHHEMLFEYCYGPRGRRQYIVLEKPKSEIETRLRLMKPIQGKLGDSKAWVARDKAWVARDKAWVARDKAWVAYDEAGVAWYATVKPKEVEALHPKECPDCPWNGKTIFPRP